MNARRQREAGPSMAHEAWVGIEEVAAHLRVAKREETKFAWQRTAYQQIR